MHWLIRLVAVCAIGSLGLTAITATGTVGLGTDRIVAAMVVLQLALLLVLGPTSARLDFRRIGKWWMGSVANDTHEHLSDRPRKTHERAVDARLDLVGNAPPGYAAMAYIQPALADQLIRVTISLVISAFMILSLSACVSAFHKQTATATAVSYGLLLAILAGTFLVWVARDQPFGRDVVRTALLFNPAAAALAEMRVAGMESYDLLPTAW